MSPNLSSKLANFVIFSTLISALLGWALPDLMRALQFYIFGILLVIIGLPHGATDFLLFKRINKANINKRQIVKFFITYLVAVFGFLIMWILLPIVSFIVFIIISAYHFGQSNWENAIKDKRVSLAINTIWGLFAIGGFVLLHWEESKVFIEQVIGMQINFTAAFMVNIQLAIICANILIILLLKNFKVIDSSRVKDELIKISVLCLLLYFTPMLVGFSIYFVLWHSLSSVQTQILYFRSLWPNFTVMDYYRQAAPFTFLALIGFVCMIYGHPLIFPDVSIISTFIVFIACVTLPHIFLVDESLQ